MTQSTARMIDLHCHSNFSDGELRPLDLVKYAVKQKIKILALTDHDTFAGLDDAHKAGKNYGIKIINGIELSTSWRQYNLHIIGLNINYLHSKIKNLVKRQNETRIARALEISKHLEKHGVFDAYNKTCDIAGHDRVGRLHFALLLKRDGFASNTQSAFKLFLNSFTYEITWANLLEVVSTIIEAGGQAVLAHPLKYNLNDTELNEIIAEFKQVGGTGIEVVSGAMTNKEVNKMADFSKNFQLLASTGSDYHGPHLSSVALGKQRLLPLNCQPIWKNWDL